MTETKPVAIVGVGAILPDAPDVQTFWSNVQRARYSITDVSPERWDPALYWDPDPSALDKTYTKIGGWVREFHFDPFKWGIAIPPRVLAVMDEAQKFAIAASYQALTDYGYPQRQLDSLRVAVILGNALAGELHYRTTMRILMPEYTQALSQTEAFKNLPADVQRALLDGMRDGVRSKTPDITEDTMPGELGNIIAGRVANVFNFAGPNYVTDAACASSLAAIQGAIEGLNSYHFDAVLTGGVDRHMGVESFVKFSKIGALSPDGSRPYADGANGFVMGEGAGILLLKRLADAERDGDKIYAVIRAVAGSSDGKGKGITAPNPLGQQRAIERAWQAAGVSPVSVGLIEGHGTSTRVGDVAEVNSLNAVFGQFGLPVGSVAIGSVKSNIGHLKSAAGAAGVLKVAMALHDKMLPPSANFAKPNPNIDFPHLPFYVNTTLQPWERNPGEIRRAGVSSFGFGGTNFHVVMEEWVPGLLTGEKKVFAVAQAGAAAQPPSPQAAPAPLAAASTAVPYRGLLFLSGATAEELKQRLLETLEAARKGTLPASKIPSPSQLAQPERLAIDYGDAEELVKRAEKALKGFENNTPAGWQALAGHAIYRGSGKAGKIAFLFPGQGSQYVNMLRDLREVEPVVAETFREADEAMTPILGRPLTSYIYDEGDEESQKKAEAELRNTAITQPAVLTTNVALLRVMEKFGFKPDMVIGHSLGEYAALVAAGVLTFSEALQVVSARGREMTKISVADNGCMAAVSAPIEQVEKIIQGINGYVVIANINSPLQCVIGGETAAVDAALAAFQEAGLQATKIPVSHAFHTRLVAPASEPLRRVIANMDVHTPRLPIVANVTGKIYPTTREEILDILAQQVASPVQFIKGVRTLYEQGVRIFVEVGPKRVLNAIVVDILKDEPDTSIFATNHPRKGGVPSFNEALCALYAAGAGGNASPQPQPAITLHSAQTEPVEPVAPSALSAVPVNGKLPLTGSVVVSGTGLGLPGLHKAVFAEDNVQRILNGEIFIESLPDSARQSMAERNPVRLIKSEAGALMQMIDNPDLAVKLGGQSGSFDVVQEFGVPEERAEATDISTQLAIASGIDALREAGIPLVMNYRLTSKGTYLPNRWMLPEALADETGVIFASAFPGLDRMAEEAAHYYEHQRHLRQLEDFESLLTTFPSDQKEARALLETRINSLKEKLSRAPYSFDRKFVFRVLPMGHSQFAEHIGARGPNTHVNAACASTTHAVSVAEDWIRAGRCRRVVIVSGDDVTRENMISWIGTGLFASGAATTEGDLRQAVLPFDRRRNGMIMGMGAAALVVESEDAVRERGMRGICEVLASQIANSAFHGTRLDVDHVSQVMDRLLRQAEDRFGIRRQEIAPRTVFVSHETYTPARGGSASAEVHALRYTFGEQANRVVIANTKGFTGHAMGVGVEDVVAVKVLETGIVPPIANLDGSFEPDPELGDLNLSRGGQYPAQYTLRLGAGFGSQIAMTLMRKIPANAGERVNRPVYERWLAAMSGYEKADLEIVQHTLRVRDAGQPANAPARSTWQFGQGPTAWADYEKEVPAVQPTLVELTTQTAVSISGNGHTPQTAAVVVPQALPPAPTPTAGTDNEAIKAYVLSLVSEKTGYPVEMLDLDLDLEADLGIDTVKQAELFAAVRTHYDIPRREDLRLADYNTLSKVMGFIKENLAIAQPAAAAVPIAPAVSAAPAPAPAATIAQPAATGGTDDEAIKAYVLALVSEKTGYPVEMLDLDLDLEADLGIDTVKQAELFAAVRTHYDIPRREDLRLADYNTLSKVIGFIKENLAAAQPAVVTAPIAPAVSAAPAPVAAVSQAVPATSTDDDAIKAYILSAVSEKTGYPVEMLDLDLDLEADLGIDTVKQAELFAAVRTHYDIPRREDLRLADYNTLSKVMGFIKDNIGGAQPAAAAAPIAPAVSAAPAPVAAVSQAVPAAGTDDDAIKAYILSAVSEKTGYPIEMLDLDLDLEADLGIDTVKQAELFAAVRTHYDIPRREDLRLADYNTLAKVMGFIKENLAAAQPAVVAVPAAVEAPPAAPSVPVSEGENEAIKSYVLAAVSEKTGYPIEMLDLDLDLEADLGIDTVKQAELFATIRTHYDIPRREDLRLADYNTLSKVIQYMKEALQARLEPPAPIQETAPVVEAELQPQSSEEPQPQPEEEPQSQTAEAQPAVVIQRRVPVPVLRPRIDLCLPTSAALERGWRVLIIGGGKTGDLLARRLQTRQVSAINLDPAEPEVMPKAVTEQLAEGPIHGVYYLPALEVEPPLSELTPKTWQTATRERLFSLYRLMRALPEDVFLVCATRFGGLHGYTPKGASAPLGGTVSGFAKALARERPNALIKVVDFEEDAPESLVASRLIQETLRDPAVVEVGWENEQRFTIVLSEQPVPTEQPALQFEKGSVFLVSGGTGGITAPIVTDLAQNTGGHFYLLGRSPLPSADDPDLPRLKSDPNGLKKDLMARLSQPGAKATPVEVGQKISALERAAATLEAIAAVEQAGGKAVYLPCDVSNPAAVNSVVKEVEKKEGRVDVLIHAAGVERSRKLENKPLDEFENTFAVKADGFFNLYYALKQNKCLPRAVIAFSSVAGRLGNSGQTDYAAANDLLARLALAMRRQRPEMQTLVIDWGAWAEVGMASRGSIPRLMELAGIEMMKPADAAPLVYKELVSGASGEVLLSGSIGILLQQAQPDGGLDIEQANKALTEGKPIHTMFSRITGLDLLKGVILEADLDPQTEQYLKDHALNGIPVLPGVMGIEGFSVAARHISSVLGSARGSFRVASLEDIHFLAPFKFYRNEKRRITWNAQAVNTGSGLVVHVSLESNSVSKMRPDRRLLHFTGKVILLSSSEALEKAVIKPPHWNGAYKVDAEHIYQLYFHGPTFQVLEAVQRSEDGVIGKLRADLPPIIGDRQTSLTRPALVELCLQTAGIWEIGKTGVLALPGSIGSLKLYEVRPSDAAIFAQVQPRQENGYMSFDAQVVDGRGRLYLELKDYRTSPLPYAVEERLVEPLKKLVE